MSRDKVNERINSRMTPQQQSKSHVGLIVISSLLVICVLVGVIAVLLFRKESDSKPVNEVITPDNVEEVISSIEEKEFIPIGYYQVTMNTEWEFPDASSPSTNAYVENCVYNQNTVYFKVALKDNPETVIYTSPYLTVGSHIEDIQLDDETIAPGHYDAVVEYILVDEEYNDLSSVSVSVEITINN